VSFSCDGCGLELELTSLEKLQHIQLCSPHQTGKFSFRVQISARVEIFYPNFSVLVYRHGCKRMCLEVMRKGYRGTILKKKVLSK
jgi:hypothetical protein